MSDDRRRTVRRALALVAIAVLVGYLAFFYTPPDVGGTADSASPGATDTAETVATSSAPTTTSGSGSESSTARTTAVTRTTATTTTTEAVSPREAAGQCGLGYEQLPNRTVRRLVTADSVRVIEMEPVSTERDVTVGEGEVVFVRGAADEPQTLQGATGGGEDGLLVVCGVTVSAPLNVTNVVLKDATVNDDRLGLGGVTTAGRVTLNADDMQTERMTVLDDGSGESTVVNGDLAVSGRVTVFGSLHVNDDLTCGSRAVAQSGRLSANGATDCP